jgi:hypothetical protein
MRVALRVTASAPFCVTVLPEAAACLLLPPFSFLLHPPSCPYFLPTLCFIQISLLSCPKEAPKHHHSSQRSANADDREMRYDDDYSFW